MDIKKGITLTAFGFLFCFVNLNLGFRGVNVNIMPAFAGWILFYLAYKRLGSFTEGKKLLKWIPPVMAVITFGVWILSIVQPDLDPGLMNLLTGIVTESYIFLIFPVLEMITQAVGSEHASTIHILRFLNLILYAGFVLLSMMVLITEDAKFALPASLTGFCVLAAALVTCMTLLQLRNEIQNY